MKWTEYLEKFEDVFEGRNQNAPYDNPSYLEYVKLNASRHNRWNKRVTLKDGVKQALDKIKCYQKWILITEPWCGDAANNSPIINMMAEYSDHIDLEIHLRDESNLIDSYLTNGSKSIPLLIVREEESEDVFIWGPRPKECQALAMQLIKDKVAPHDKNVAIQKWYRLDNGESIQDEIMELVNKACLAKTS